MKNKLYRITLATLFVASLVLAAPHLQAAESSTASPHQFGTFNDFEELHWRDEANAIILEGEEIRKKTGVKPYAYVTLGHMNLALKGNAFAAARLTDSNSFRVYAQLDEVDSTLGSEKLWQEYTEKLTSPGWAAFLADQAEPRRHFSSGRSGLHPAAVYWYNRKGRTFEKREFVKTDGGGMELKPIHEAVLKGYAYAQADLAASYAKGSSSGWLLFINSNGERMQPSDGRERMLALEKASAEQGEPYGLYMLAGSYSMGYHGEPDKETALMYYILAHRFIKKQLRPNALSHPEDDSEFLFGIKGLSRQLEPSKEMFDRATARADEWEAEFMKKREAAYAPVRERRAQLAAAMREKYRDEYIRVYGILKNQGIDLPPSIFEAGK